MTEPLESGTAPTAVDPTAEVEPSDQFLSSLTAAMRRVACAGAITGLCVHVALVVLVCHLAPERVLGRYVAGTYSERIYGALGLRWPVVMAADGAREVDQVLERSPHHVHPRGTVR